MAEPQEGIERLELIARYDAAIFQKINTGSAAIDVQRRIRQKYRHRAKFGEARGGLYGSDEVQEGYRSWVIAREIKDNDLVADSQEYIRERQQRYESPIAGDQEYVEAEALQQGDEIMTNSDRDRGQPQG